MLTLKNISYEAEDNEILKGVDLEFGDEFTVITGPNGSGKSTLTKIIAGIIKPTEGRILWDGEDITDLSITERAKLGISYAFQQPVQFKGLRVRDLMMLAAGKDAKFNDICDILSEVGLCARDYIDRDLDGSLSGGEMKRIEIAMVLARKTRFSIFDEPEAGIDLWSFQNLTYVFEKMRKLINGGILIISHQERILNIADKILYLKDGETVCFDKRDKVLPLLLDNSANGPCSILKEKMGE
jgi:Fe-S cluster assembly ATP-binding protein